MKGILLNTFGVHIESCRSSLFCLEFLLMLKDSGGEKEGYCLNSCDWKGGYCKENRLRLYGWLRTDSVDT